MTTRPSRPMTGRAAGGRRHRAGWLVAVLTVTAIGLAACGDEGDGSGAADEAGAQTATPSPPAQASTGSPGSGEPILVKTRINGFAGEVVDGSTLAGSPFCAGGTVRHERGSPDIGFPAVNVFDCSDGQLQVGFGPGADQMNDIVQTSGWKVLEGSGRFEGMTGEGQMKVEWESLGSEHGEETFTGTVLVP
jgi:hypothetical protein